MRESPTDICVCGDYRHQHESGTGRCRMPDDICHGMQPCKSFRLVGKSEQPEQECKQVIHIEASKIKGGIDLPHDMVQPGQQPQAEQEWKISDAVMQSPGGAPNGILVSEQECEDLALYMRRDLLDSLGGAAEYMNKADGNVDGIAVGIPPKLSVTGVLERVDWRLGTITVDVGDNWGDLRKLVGHLIHLTEPE